MRDIFAAWYRRSNEELSSLWQEALFVPDTNIMLHCLRHSAEVREELLRVFEELGDQVWIPYQVGLEFHRNRLDVEVGAIEAYDKLLRDYDAAFTQIKEKLKQLRSHPTIAVQQEAVAIDEFQAQVRSRLEGSRLAHPSDQIAEALGRLTALFQGRVGPKPSADRASAIRREGEERYTKKIPPGYKDQRKTEGDGDRFGDFIIWKEMIEKAHEEKKPIVFITDDAKEDWWLVHRGKKQGPRPELLEEFRHLTAQDFHIYELTQFLRIASETRVKMTETSIAQIEQSVVEEDGARRKKWALGAELEGLEVERDRIIADLAGVPDVSVSKSEPIDKAYLRHELSRVDALIRSIRTALLETDTSADA